MMRISFVPLDKTSAAEQDREDYTTIICDSDCGKGCPGAHLIEEVPTDEVEDRRS